jgi:DNA polymerase-3 subunit beta
VTVKEGRMRIQGEKDALLEVGQAVLRVVSPRATLPVLGGVRISAAGGDVEFAATDLELFVRVVGEFAVEEEGRVVVPGRLLGDILRSLPAGAVVIEGTEAEIRLAGGRSEFTVSGLAVSDFPTIPAVEAEAASRVEAVELARALRQVVRAAGTDEARPVLTGVLWLVEGETLRLVATDSYRLAVRELLMKEGPGGGRAIVPGRALGELGRHLTMAGVGQVDVALGQNQAEFSAGRAKVVTRLIEGEFPNYRQLLPSGYPNRLVAAREALLETVGRVALVAQANTPVKLHLEDEVRVTAVESGVAEAWEVVTEAEYSGEPMVVAFNPKFLADGIEGIESDRAVLEVADPLKPGLLKAEDRDDFVYLVMPVRLAR